MIIFLFSLIIFSNFYAQDKINPNIIILDDASVADQNKWTMIGPNIKGSGAIYIDNELERKKVIQLKGFGLKNVFVFKDKNGSYFDLKGYRAIQWKMRYSEPFIVQILVSTSKGKKYLVYSDLPNKVNTENTYLHFGLGSNFRNGKWHTITRDLLADLHSVLPETELKAIHAIFFRGSGYIDDIWALKDKPTDIIVEDGEMHGLEGWDMLNKGGLLELDSDPQLGAIIKFDSGKEDVPFRLRKPDGSYWKVKTNVVIQWKMKMEAAYKIYIIGDSTEGKFLFSYDDNDTSNLLDESTGMIHYGLGSNTIDSKWRVITRDLSEDIKKAKPGIDVLAVSSIIIRGKGWIDDIKLLAEPPSSVDIAYGWDIFDNQPEGATIRVVNDLSKGSVVELLGDSVQNGYRYSGKSGGMQSTAKPYIKWDFAFNQVFDFITLIETGTAAKYIHYIPESEAYMKKENEELFLGIGKTRTDGRWHSVVRDLSKDIKLLSDKLEYQSTKNFLVRGSGRIDQIDFFNEKPKEEFKATPSAVASVALGQFDFLHNLKNLWDISRGSTNSLNAPSAVTIDKNGSFYVTDTGNGRIAYWTKVQKVNGSSPNILLASSSLKFPSGIAVTDNYVIVSDMGNDSLFFFDKPITETSTPKFIISGFLKRPTGLFYDGNKLFVADTGNNRILVWNSLPTVENQKPDLVIGQSSIKDTKPNQDREAPTFNTMNSPTAVYSTGVSLYVADSGNNRILFYKLIPTMNGWHADYVIGQENGTGFKPNRGENISDRTLNQPSGVFAFENKLFVSDSMNNRVLVYIGNIEGNGKTADGVLGQVNFNTGYVNMSGIPGSDTLFLPQQGASYNGILFICDTSNHRVLIY